MNDDFFWLIIILSVILVLLLVAYLNHIYGIEAGYLPKAAGVIK